MRRRRVSIVRVIAPILIIWVLAPTALLAQAPPAPPVEGAVGAELEATPVSLLVGRSTVIDTGAAITRVSLTSADIADALVTSPNQLLVNGKMPGMISMFVWHRGGTIKRYEVAVQRDLVRLQGQLKELFPTQAIEAHSNGRQIVLSGTVPDKDVVARVVDVAAGYVERREDVVTLLQLPPAQPVRSNQVLLRVRFAEVSRSALWPVAFAG